MLTPVMLSLLVGGRVVLSSWPAAQELQRKLAEEQVAAAMGQAPPVTSVSAGAAALGLTMGAAMQAPGAGTRTQTAPAQPVRPSPAECRTPTRFAAVAALAAQRFVLEQEVVIRFCCRARGCYTLTFGSRWWSYRASGGAACMLK